MLRSLCVKKQEHPRVHSREHSWEHLDFGENSREHSREHFWIFLVLSNYLGLPSRPTDTCHSGGWGFQLHAVPARWCPLKGPWRRTSTSRLMSHTTGRRTSSRMRCATICTFWQWLGPVLGSGVLCTFKIFIASSGYAMDRPLPKEERESTVLGIAQLWDSSGDRLAFYFQGLGIFKYTKPGNSQSAPDCSSDLGWPG